MTISSNTFRASSMEASIASLRSTVADNREHTRVWRPEMSFPSAFRPRRSFSRECRRQLAKESALPSVSSRTRGDRGITPVGGGGGFSLSGRGRSSGWGRRWCSWRQIREAGHSRWGRRICRGGAMARQVVVNWWYTSISISPDYRSAAVAALQQSLTPAGLGQWMGQRLTVGSVASAGVQGGPRAEAKARCDATSRPPALSGFVTGERPAMTTIQRSISRFR